MFWNVFGYPGLLASEASLSLVMSIELEIYFIYIFIYLLASEASLSLIMSIELEIYFIYKRCCTVMVVRLFKNSS